MFSLEDQLYHARTYRALALTKKFGFPSDVRFEVIASSQTRAVAQVSAALRNNVSSVFLCDYQEAIGKLNPMFERLGRQVGRQSVLLLDQEIPDLDWLKARPVNSRLRIDEKD